MKTKVGKVITVVCVVFALIIAILYVVLYLPLMRYIEATPKITPKSQVTVQVGDTVEWQDLFDVECKGDYTVRMSVSEQEQSAIEMSKAGQSFVAKDAAKQVVIYVYARGSNAESVSATNTITIE